MMPLRSITYRVTRVHRSDAANEMLARESHEQMTAEDIAARRHRYAARLPATCIQGDAHGRGDDVPARSRHRIHACFADECTAVGRAAVRTAMVVLRHRHRRMWRLPSTRPALRDLPTRDEGFARSF